MDVVALERAPGIPARLLAPGEATWHPVAVGTDELLRLRHIRELLESATAGIRLLLFSRSGFTPELVREAAASSDIELVDLERLYEGS